MKRSPNDLTCPDKAAHKVRPVINLTAMTARHFGLGEVGPDPDRALIIVFFEGVHALNMPRGETDADQTIKKPAERRVWKGNLGEKRETAYLKTDSFFAFFAAR